MADREHRNGRMLFTDFDASDKGRPVPVFNTGIAETAQTVQELEPPNIPSLEELAARLELTFEPDGADTDTADTGAGGTDIRPPQEPSAREIPQSSATGAPAPREDDSELTLADADILDKKAEILTAPPARNAPSWDDLANAYEQARPVEPLPPDARIAKAFVAEPKRSGEGENEISEISEISENNGSDEDENVDVLSMLDAWLEHEHSPLPPRSPKPIPEARAIPYGGVERVDDWFAPPENQPEQGEVQRVEDWFAPPENQPEQGEVQRVENWFEPPAPAAQGKTKGGADGEGKVDLSWLGDFRNELPSGEAGEPGEYWRKSTRRILKKEGDDDAEPVFHIPAVADGESGGSSPADTVALFADMDFDRIWEKKVEAEHEQTRSAETAGAAGRGAGKSDTRQIDLFDDLDIETLWSKKQEEARRDPSRTPAVSASGDSGAPAFPSAASATMILDPRRPASAGSPAAGTVILRDNVLPPQPAMQSAELENESENDDIDVLSALDETLPAPSEKPAPPAQAEEAIAPEPAPEPKEEETTPATPDASDSTDDSTDDSPDLDALIEEAAELHSDTADIADGDNGGNGDNSGIAQNIFGDGSASSADRGDEEHEYVARTPPAGSGTEKEQEQGQDNTRKKDLTTDDLLNDLDLDAFSGEAEDVSAPVIDNSAINAIGGAPSGDGDDGAPAAGSAEGGEGGEGGEPVAVNPMDVFADMDNMDFSDDMDDDMRAMMEEEEDGETEEGAPGAEGGAQAAAVPEEEEIPTTRLGLALYRARKLVRRFLPAKAFDAALTMVAWRENWWFYCDLVAAVVASASLAVIISYFLWYRQ